MTGDLREPWFRPDPVTARTFEDELRAEVAPDHELSGVILHAEVTCGGCDDVVFRGPDDTFAIVRLTWTSVKETPPWPRTMRLDSSVELGAAMDQHEH